MSSDQSPHWVDTLTDGILKWQKKYAIPVLHVDDMKTPSGRVHVGSLRGVILHDVVAKVLEKKSPVPVISTYVFNNMDNMDGLPSYLPKEYEQHMGKPLHKIPAPPLDESGIDFSNSSDEEKKAYTSAKNMGDFYAQDFIEAYQRIGCHQEEVWSSELYESGQMDDTIRQALDSVESFRKIYQEVADYQLPEKWYPIQVQCENCGIAGSTLVTDWDGTTVAYECQPNKVEWATGCGHAGRVSPFKGNAKLLWKVDWPAHWKVMGVTVEGAGKDHTSDGGSRDMANAICKEVFEIQPPFDIPYEWILVRGAKMSSSKGVGTSAREFVSLLPPSVGRFLFVNKHYNQVIDFDPNTMAVPDLFDEYDAAARIHWKQEEGDTRLGRSFELSQVGTPQKECYLPRFREVALRMQHPEINLVEWFEQDKGAALTAEEHAVLAERLEYAQKWVSLYAPEEFQLTPREEVPEAAKELTQEQREFLEEIMRLLETKDWQPEELQQAIFDTAKAGVGSKQGFQAIYQAFLGKKSGPKAAWFLLSIPKELRQKRITQLSSIS